MNKKTGFIFAAVALAGIILSLLLLKQHYDIKEHGFAKKSFCTINEVINCDVVNGSSYSEMLGLPLAGWGLLYYVFVFLTALRGLFASKPPQDAIAFLYFPALFSVGFTFYTAAISWFKLNALCLLCLGLYGANVALFLLLPGVLGISIAAYPAWVLGYVSALFQQGKKSFNPKPIQNLVVYAIFMAIGFGILYQVEAGIQKKPAHGHKHPDLTQLLEMHFKQEKVILDAGNRPLWGEKGAPVTIIEFSDFQCPFCQKAAEVLKPSLAEYGDKIALYFVNYPLDSSCNIYVTKAMHANACTAAKASLCGEKNGKFWELHDLMFANQKKLSTGEIIDYAKQVGIGEKEFKDCLFDPETDKKVKEDIELGQTVDISGTPTIFINGRRVSNWTNVEFLRSVVERELEIYQ